MSALRPPIPAEREAWIPRGLPAEREAICREALRHVGLREIPHASNRGPVEVCFPLWQIRALVAEDKKTKRLTKGPAWCAYMVNYTWWEALGRWPLGGHLGAVRRMVQEAKARGLWMEAPKDTDLLLGVHPGDAFCQLVDAGTTGHTGVILRVSECGREWVTVEGNAGHRWQVLRRRYDSARMRGVVSVLGDASEALDFERGCGPLAHVPYTGNIATR